MKKKIELNFEKSPYKYEWNEWKFSFSSITNLEKFKAQIEDYILSESFILKRKYLLNNIDFDSFLIVSLYKRIEKRGFSINYNGIDLRENTLFITSFVDDTAVHF